jgi:hypothetical protein
MAADRRADSNRVRLMAALAYATVVAILAAGVFPRTAATPPLVLIALGLPLVLRLVPRNHLYGFRSARTLWTTEDIWYLHNVFTGVVMVGAGVIWLIVLAVR